MLILEYISTHGTPGWCAARMSARESKGPLPAYEQLCEARWLSGRMPDSQSREPGFESPLIPFRSLGIFFHFTTPQSTQLYK